MAAKPKTPAEAAAHFQAFLCAGILDLCRLVKLPELRDLCPGARHVGRPAITLGVAPIPAAAQLSMYLILLSRCLEPKHELVYPHEARLRDLLKLIYRKAITRWDRGELKAIDELGPGVRTLARFAHKRIPLFEYTTDGLDAFGVKDIEESLAILTERCAMAHARVIADKLAKDPASVPPEVIGASLVASATSPGLAARLGTTVDGLMQLGVRAASGRETARKPGRKASAKASRQISGLRTFLKRTRRSIEG